MHASQREERILGLLGERGFMTFRDLSRFLDASAATIRRDLERLDGSGRIVRVRGGARLPPGDAGPRLSGTPFAVSIGRNVEAKEAIGRAAAALCLPGESVIIDGGSTTLQMCGHLAPLGLQVLTNSLPIVSALIAQPATRVAVPSGNIFREQEIILSPFEEDGTSTYRASRMFMGAAGLGPHGLMQTDVLLMQAEQRLMSRANELIVLVDSSKFKTPVGHVLCPLSRISTVITDDRVRAEDVAMLEAAGVKVIRAPAEASGP